METKSAKTASGAAVTSPVTPFPPSSPAASAASGVVNAVSAVLAGGGTTSSAVVSIVKKDTLSTVKSLKASIKNPTACRDHLIALHAKMHDPEDPKGARACFQKFILNTTGGIAAVLSTTEAHALDSPFVEAALAFLYSLIFYQSAKRNLRVITKLVKRSAAKTVLTALNKNMANNRAIQLGAAIIVALAPSDTKLQATGRLTGCIPNLLSVAKNHSTLPKEGVAGALSCLCVLAKGDTNLSHLAKKGAIAIVADLCAKQLQRQGSIVLPWGFRLLFNLSCVDENAKELIKEGGVPLALNVLFEHSASVELQKLAVDVLRNLVRLQDGLSQFLSSGGFSHVVNLVAENNADKGESELVELVVQLYRLFDLVDLPIGGDNELYWEPLDTDDPVNPVAPSAAEVTSGATSPVDSDGTGEQSAASPPQEPLIPFADFSPELQGGFITPETTLDGSVVVHHVKPFTDQRPSPSCPSCIDFVPPVEELLVQSASHRAAIVLSQLRRLRQPHLVLNSVVYDDLEREVAMPPSKLALAANSVAGSQAAAKASERSTIPALRFSSRFESGNLKRAIRVFDDEYDLILNTDINTTSYIQWFYFCIEGARSDVTYKFNIINMEKPSSSFNDGQRVLMFSERRFMWSGFGWLRAGHDIMYHKNSYKRRAAKRKGKEAGSSYYTLTFSIRFPHDEDRVYIANCYPYTYSDLIGYLRKVQDLPGVSDYFMAQNMCCTQSGNATPLVTITTLRKDGVACSPDEIARRNVCIVSARVHPGESNASYVAKGLMEYLLGDTPNAEYLRNNFVWKIIPMLNPDGVVNGNHRCALSGKDLNREFARPSWRLNPTIYWLKALCRYWKATENRNLMLYGDFHGHSRRRNFFIYACSSRKLTQGIVVEKIFPKLMSELTPYFSYEGSGYKVQRAKRNTGRVVFWRELGIRMSFTLEGSMMGGDACDFLPVSFGEVEEDIARKSALSRGTVGHFSSGHYCTVGAMFAKTVMLISQGESGAQSRANDVISDLITEAAAERGASRKSAAPSTPNTPLAEEFSNGDEKSSIAGSYASSRRGSLRRGVAATAAKKNAASSSQPMQQQTSQQYQASPSDLAEVYRVLTRNGPASATAKSLALSDGGGEESDADADDMLVEGDDGDGGDEPLDDGDDPDEDDTDALDDVRSGQRTPDEIDDGETD